MNPTVRLLALAGLTGVLLAVAVLAGLVQAADRGWISL